MDEGVISARYAKALLKSATLAKVEEQVYHDMMTLSKSYIDVPALRQAIDNPMLMKAEKQSLLETASGATPSALTKRFISLVLDEEREKVMQLMATSYISLYRKQKDIIRGRLVTATAVSSDMEQKMKEMVEKKIQGTVEFLTEVNPDIIGGFILEYDTYRMDASVKTKLKKILAGLKQQ